MSEYARLPNFLASLLRVYSFVFHLTLGVFLVTISAISYRSHFPLNHYPFSLDMLPFAEDNFLRNTLLLGISGIFFSLLALTRGFKFAFFLWTALAFFLMLKWFFLQSYVFDDAHQARGALWLTFGSVGAFFGAGWSLRSRQRLPIL